MRDDVSDGQGIDDDKAHAHQHSAEQDAKAGRDADQLNVAEFIVGFDIPEQAQGGEDPPGIAEEGFVGTCMGKKLAFATEVELRGRLTELLIPSLYVCVGERTKLATISRSQYGCARRTVVM